MKQKQKNTIVLGISAFYHDSAATLIINGEIVAAAHEERFTRKKHDECFPENAVRYALSEYGLNPEDLSAVVFYDKPILKFERILETYHAIAPKGLIGFLTAMPIWAKEKLFTRGLIRKGIKTACGKSLPKNVPLLFSEHHASHAASAFYPSPFESAAILTIDGVGEWATTTIARGRGREIEIIKEMKFPHSLGLLYSAFTYYCGFKVNSGEYKLMGLAPYGSKNSVRVKDYIHKIKEKIVDIKKDGSFFLRMEYFDFLRGLYMTNNKKWLELFGVPPRCPESEIAEEYMDMALAIQNVTEEIVILLAITARKETGLSNLVMAGGVALNCVANARILEEKIFDNIWVQPASGDAGGALGASFLGYHVFLGKDRKVSSPDAMRGAFLGPEYGDNDTVRVARKYGADFKQYDDFDNLAMDTARLIAEGNVVGWMQGRMEYGPRALGNRSILADPRNPDTQRKLNLKIKYREGFRPFAPSVLESDASCYFDMKTLSMPYMLFTATVSKNHRKPQIETGTLYEKLYCLRSDIPSITHLDYSARLQTVNESTNKRYAGLLNFFKDITGYGLLVNTSFNVRGEPIVCTPEDAYRCFMNTEMDYLVVGNFLFDKKKQPQWEKFSLEKTHGAD